MAMRPCHTVTGIDRLNKCTRSGGCSSGCITRCSQSVTPLSSYVSQTIDTTRTTRAPARPPTDRPTDRSTRCRRRPFKLRLITGATTRCYTCTGVTAAAVINGQITVDAGGGGGARSPNNKLWLACCNWILDPRRLFCPDRGPVESYDENYCRACCSWDDIWFAIDSRLP